MPEKTLAEGQSPPQELEVGPRSEPHLLENLKTNLQKKPSLGGCLCCCPCSCHLHLTIPRENVNTLDLPQRDAGDDTNTLTNIQTGIVTYRLNQLIQNT